jgi:excisionase family DNA binding protein
MERDKTYSPAQLAPIIGVSESTLKRWIDAGHLRAEKTPGGHRKVAVADLVAFLRSRGRPVPSLEGLAVLAGRFQSPEADVTPDTLARLLVRGDGPVVREMILGQFRAGQPLDAILDRLVAPAMAEVGTQWERGKVDVYEEHLATLRAWSVLTELRGLLPVPPDSAPLALGGAPEGDPYLLPTMMAELTLAELGWRTVNLGPNTPVASFRHAIDRYAPRLVWISITSLSPRPAFVEGDPPLFEAAESRGIRVALGGQGLTAKLQDRLVASAFGTRLAHLKAFARTLAT